MNHVTNEIVNKYLENELTETEFILLDSHLNECETCRQKLGFNKILFSKLKNDTLLTPSLNFSDKVMQEVLKTSKPKFDIKRIFSSQNIYILFFTSVLGLYGLLSIFFNKKETESYPLTDFISPYYKKTIDFFYTNLEPFQKYINILFQRDGFFYFFLGIGFIILFMLFDKYVVERKPKQKSIGMFLI